VAASQAKRLHPYLRWPGPLAFAHQGGAGAHPENTERAFRHSVELGFVHLETDVHATSDGVAVVFHDESLDRVTDGSGLIREHSFAELRKVRVVGTEEIMRLDDLLAAFPDRRFNLDPKHDSAVGPLADVLRRADALDRVCVCSFSTRRTRRVKQLLGDGLCTGAGPLDVVAAIARGWRIPLPRRGIDVLQVPVRSGIIPVVSRRLVAAAHRAGLQVHVWTVDDPAEMHRLLDLGVDGLMTDDPGTLKAVYTERGHWFG